MPGTARSWGAWWVLLAALYLVLADNPAVPELVVGAVAAAIGATGAVLTRRQRRELLRPRIRWLRGAWRPATGLFTDLVPLTRALVTRGILRRAGAGDLVAVPVTIAGDAGERAAYAAFSEALGSLAPNSIVVDVDEERGVLLVHELVPTGDPAPPLRS
jgi:multisubunit Na+/H+ antiporter MnhE subunit